MTKTMHTKNIASYTLSQNYRKFPFCSHKTDKITSPRAKSILCFTIRIYVDIYSKRITTANITRRFNFSLFHCITAVRKSPVKMLSYVVSLKCILLLIIWTPLSYNRKKKNILIVFLFSLWYFNVVVSLFFLIVMRTLLSSSFMEFYLNMLLLFLSTVHLYGHGQVKEMVFFIENRI